MGEVTKGLRRKRWLRVGPTFCVPLYWWKAFKAMCEDGSMGTLLGRRASSPSQFLCDKNVDECELEI